MKGFDVYTKLDELLYDKKLKKKFKFTYVGNLPKNVYFKNSTHIKPLSGKKLAKELSKHHVYLTASINEPAGMHHIEGALSGLPLVYRKSGALPEYCNGYGIQFTDNDFLSSIQSISKRYLKFKNELKNYPYTSEEMSSNYISLFKKLLKKKDEIIKKRRIFRNPFKLLINLLIL